ncbi:MAG: leucine--tRNA ligase [Bacteroidales bacterium]|nr:leucine--tRNA ligase [Bacteroidales bacterium]
MEYNFSEIEKKWQQYWKDNKTFKSEIDANKQKYYVLDMFPYPSGAGLHVGHPLGYIASDIFARYKRQKGFNVLHPMGFDAYGLPAEQYAIQTGQHPAITTEKNIARYKQQLDIIGLSYDWDREVRTCDSHYYKWTQWTFIQLFNSYYCFDCNKARPISELISAFEQGKAGELNVACSKPMSFTAEDWASFTEKEQSDILMNYRLAYLSTSMVNWCPKLGTVLANDEVVNGVSVRGGYPVERKPMQQWSLRITAYAERLLEGLNDLDWTDSIKEIQRNWIGKSRGCAVYFGVYGHDEQIEVFTTRADTIFGVSFMVLSPEHPMVEKITTPNYKIEVKRYIEQTKSRSDREREAEVKQVSGIFTGAYAVHPITKKQIPIYISDYVLMGYGTGAIMAVPAHDSRDFAFAKKFMIPILQVVLPDGEEESNTYAWKESKDAKEGKMIHSQFLDGLEVKDAINKAIDYIESNNLGYATTNYRLRDAIFSRQRYWGEPFPIYYKDGIPYALDEKELPLLLPEVDSFLPTETGEPPLARAKNWCTKEGYPYETNTMPGFAGSNAYSLRYMDPTNDEEFFTKEANNYWENVDLYVGGSEHATGHLLYSRFITKFLFDIGATCKDEPYKRLVNQGMIQGKSCFVYRIQGENKYVSFNLKGEYETDPIHIDISLVDASNNEVDIEGLRNWREEFKDAEFILEDGKYICGNEVEKMSKSLYNVINPDYLVEKYGADTLRLYEMFLGPIEQSKPWDVQGIEGVSRFLKKFWRLYANDNGLCVTDEEPTKDELKILHRGIKKIEDDIERFSLNTCVSSFMIICNELNEKKCHKKSILKPLCSLIASFAPHIAEELWHLMGENSSVAFAGFPVFNEEYLKDTDYRYPISINGKTKTFICFPLDKDAEELKQEVLQNEQVKNAIADKEVVKIIFVPNKIVNIVVKN